MLDSLGGLLSVCAQMLQNLTSILIAKGWTVTEPDLKGRYQLAGLFGLLLMGYISLFVWWEVFKVSGFQ